MEHKVSVRRYQPHTLRRTVKPASNPSRLSILPRLFDADSTNCFYPASTQLRLVGLSRTILAFHPPSSLFILRSPTPLDAKG
jgi:hypothetical protein